MGNAFLYFGWHLLAAGVIVQVPALVVGGYGSGVLWAAGACVALAGLLMSSIGFVLVMRNRS